MSFIYADGGIECRVCEGCGRRERVPADASAGTAVGWLFLQDLDGPLGYRHYCRGCRVLLSKCHFVRQALIHQAGKLR